MKFIHISDLHLGKRVNEFSMLEEQKYILQQVLDTVQNEAADAVLIAGDIYDKPVPPAEAVVLFDTFLTRLSQMKKEVFIISGNHDSAERLSFGSSLFTAEGIHIAPVFEGNMEKVSLWDDAGEVCVYLLPFIKPSTVRRFYEEDLTDYTKTVQTVIEHTPVDTSKRNVLVAHQFVTGAGRCDSEEVSVGGLDNVDASVFEPFDYVALGHIHNAQHCSRESVRYCGTLLKYSFSEVNHIKSITVVEVKEKGKNPQIHTVPVTPGIMPVTSAAQIQRMVKMCGATLPDSLQKIVERYADNKPAMMEAGIYYAVNQILDLLANDMHGIHLYTMNNPEVAKKICAGIQHLI